MPTLFYRTFAYFYGKKWVFEIGKKKKKQAIYNCTKKKNEGILLHNVAEN